MAESEPTPMQRLMAIVDMARAKHRGAQGTYSFLSMDDETAWLIYRLTDEELGRLSFEVAPLAQEGNAIACTLERGIRSEAYNREVVAKRERDRAESAARMAERRREPSAEEIAARRRSEAHGRAIDAALAAGTDTFDRAYRKAAKELSDDAT